MKITHLNFAQSTLLLGTIDPQILQDHFKVSAEDFFILTDYKIAQIRELLHFVNLKPYNSQKRLAVIPNAEKLSSLLANTLLKTLEEPPEHAQIILTTLNESKIIPTILSRCQKIRLQKLDTAPEPENYLDPQVLAQLPVYEKFKWVGSMIETDDLELILTYHQEYFHQKLLKGDDVSAILKQISIAKDLLQSNISVKLLIENLMMQYLDERKS